MYDYMVSGSQNATCFSNRGEFTLSVVSQYVVLWSLFFDSLNSYDKLLCFFQFLLVRLYFSCFTCVAGLESNIYRHHLHLSKVSAFCTTIVWPMYPSRGAAWIPHSLSFCKGMQIPHSLSLEVTWTSAERSIKRRVGSYSKKCRA